MKTSHLITAPVLNEVLEDDLQFFAYAPPIHPIGKSGKNGSFERGSQYFFVKWIEWPGCSKDTAVGIGLYIRSGLQENLGLVSRWQISLGDVRTSNRYREEDIIDPFLGGVCFKYDDPCSYMVWDTFWESDSDHNVFGDEFWRNSFKNDDNYNSFNALCGIDVLSQQLVKPMVYEAPGKKIEELLEDIKRCWDQVHVWLVINSLTVERV